MGKKRNALEPGDLKRVNQLKDGGRDGVIILLL
jgi:hypothetical protein